MGIVPTVRVALNALVNPPCQIGTQPPTCGYRLCAFHALPPRKTSPSPGAGGLGAGGHPVILFSQVNPLCHFGTHGLTCADGAIAGEADVKPWGGVLTLRVIVRSLLRPS